MRWLINIFIFSSVVLVVLGAARIRFKKLEDENRQMKIGKGMLLFLKPLIQVMAYFLQKWNEAKINRRYAKKLLISGNEMHLLPVEFVALKWISALSGTAAGLFIVSTTQVNGIACIVLGILFFFYPDLWLHETTVKRKHAISRDLPYCMDLLTLAIEAGASFQGAVEKIVNKGIKGALRSELEKMLQDLRLGLSRREALLALSQRTDLYVIRSFTAAMIQAEKLGTPVGEALRIQSDLRRDERFNKLEKIAQEAPVKMLFPLMFFILPSVFIIILGPIGLKFLAEGM